MSQKKSTNSLTALLFLSSLTTSEVWPVIVIALAACRLIPPLQVCSSTCASLRGPALTSPGLISLPALMASRLFERSELENPRTGRKYEF